MVDSSPPNLSLFFFLNERMEMCVVCEIFPLEYYFYYTTFVCGIFDIYKSRFMLWVFGSSHVYVMIFVDSIL
jgi:hypothetical protein